MVAWSGNASDIFTFYASIATAGNAIQIGIPTDSPSSEQAQLWQQVKTIAADALERPSAERAQWVREACRGDAAKIEAVMGLLGFTSALSETEPMNTFQRHAAQIGGAGQFSGKKIGPYQVHWRLGAGGMGEVYLATRTENVRMRVALKFLRPDCTHPGLVHRFRAEAQILAALDHRNIVKLLDAGETEDQQPYFVMEYVEGLPIDKWCVEHRSSLNQRLNLFREICQAVQYAHSHLLVHRDLKPGNILVTLDGSVKLLDFGIARLLRPELLLGGGDDLPTASWEHPLTPSYASPEQLRGSAVSTATDIYALGVVLFELLTGSVPFAPKKDSTWPEFVRTVTEENPPRPSSTIQTLAHQKIGRELDNIVLKAIDKVPERRYLTAQEMADDVASYQAGLPVRAHPNSLPYRAGKYVRRHAAALGAVVAVVTSMAAGLAVSLREKSEADSRLQQVHDLAATMGTTFSKVETSCFPPASSAQKNVTAAESAALNNPNDLALQDQLARSYAVLAATLKSDHQDADASTVIQKLIALRTRLAKEQPDNQKAQNDLAAVLQQYAPSGTVLGFATGGEPAQNAVSKPPVQRDGSDMALALIQLGDVLRLTGDESGARKAYQASMDMITEQLKIDPANARLKDALARAQAAAGK